jgi:acyl-CoA synthetase (AMP-forming)/AMP-acid ligase II
MGSIPVNNHDKFEELLPLNKTHEPKLFINVIEQKAKWLSNHTFMRYPSANWELDGYRTITWKQYADAINKIAHWLDAELGKSTDNETLAYLGPNDARYAIMLAAMVKTGRQVRFSHTKSAWIRD